VDIGVNKVGSMMQNTNNQFTDSNSDQKEQLYITQDVDAYNDNVDHLMDDLFGEVETTLHVDYVKQRSLKQKNGQSQQPRISAPYASINSSSSDMVAFTRVDPDQRDTLTFKDTVSITKLNLADISLPPISKQDVLWIQPYITRNPEPPSNIPPTDSGTVAQPHNLLDRNNLLDRILLVATCSSALIAAVMWTINHRIWIGKQSVSVAQVTPKNTSENKTFGEEIRRMLSEVVDKNRPIATNLNGVSSTIPLLTSPLLGNMQLPVGTNNPLVNGLQSPMYVPVYQPPALNGTNAPSPLALPPMTSNNAIDVAKSPITTRQNAPTSTQVAAAPAPSYPSYILIGVLDLGDRSTAMLDMNGSVLSIGLGKAIGNTGWSLSRVSQQEITLKRGKETKTILVGQRF